MSLVAIIALLIPLVTVVGVIFLIGLKIIMGSSSAGNTEQQRREAELIQELHQGFIKMEQRIEALETIMLERKGADR